jgi:homoserine O-acetyltransferase
MKAVPLAPRSDAWSFIVNRENFEDCEVAPSPVPSAKEVPEGSVLIEVDRFSLTANNILYAVLGDEYHYWDLFPARQGFGIIPVWGFGDVIESRHPEIATGERLYGFFPMATHLQVQVADVTARRVRDAAPHRQAAAAPYNNYIRVTDDRAFEGRQGDYQALFRPLFLVSFLAENYFAESDFFGAKTIVVSSASSKTSLALAWLLHTRHRSIRVVGITSQKNAEFVRGVGYYDATVTYEDISSLDGGEPIIFFDVAGNWDARAALHQRFGDNVKHSARVGMAHWDAPPNTEELPGAPPTLFFGPVYMERFNKAWGPAGFAERFDTAWREFAQALDGWMNLVEGHGAGAVVEAYLQTLKGQGRPDEGLILSARPVSSLDEDGPSHQKEIHLPLGIRSAAGAVLGLLVSGAESGGPSLAQPTASAPTTSAAPTGPWDRQANTAAVQANAWFENYRFRDGETLDRLRIHYATLGAPHRDGKGDIDNAVLVLHWTGADSRALLSPVFMRSLYAPGRPLDARRYYLIFADSVGHGQSSKPSDGLKAKFPNYGYGDIVDLQHKLVTETLGVRHLHAILGMSMGGMNAWQWAEAYPDMMDGVMPVVSLPIKVSGRNILWRRMVIDAIRSDPDWKGGDYAQPPSSWLQGYQVLRMMIDGVPHLQAVIPDSAAADAFIAQARDQAAHTDANDVLYSLKSSADYDPAPGLAAIKTKLFALNFSDDEFNPDRLQILERLMPRVTNGRFVVQEGTAQSPGHLTMARPDLWAQHVGEFMQWLGDAPPAAP